MYLEAEYNFDRGPGRSSELWFSPHLICTHCHTNQIAFFRSSLSVNGKGKKKKKALVNSISFPFVYLSAINVSFRRDLKFHCVGSYRGKIALLFIFALSKFQQLSCSA